MLLCSLTSCRMPRTCAHRWLTGFCAARMRDTRHFRLAVIPFSGSQSEECIAEPPLPEPQRLQKRRTCAPTCLLRDNCSVAARTRDIRHFQATGAPTRLLRRLKCARADATLEDRYTVKQHHHVPLGYALMLGRNLYEMRWAWTHINISL